MAYQQQQPQLQSYRQPGVGGGLGRQPQFGLQLEAQQPGFQQQPQPVQQQPQPVQQQPQPIQQQPQSAIAASGGQPSMQSTSPASQQMIRTPQQSSYGVPMATQQGTGQQFPQTQQPAVSPTAQQYGQIQPQQASQFDLQKPSLSSQSFPQTQSAQVPQMVGQQLSGRGVPQQLGQQTPQQAQLGGQGSSQPSGLTVSPSGQSPTGQSLQPGAGSFPSQMQGMGTESVQGMEERTEQELTGTPSIDVVDVPDEIILFVDLPGYEEENIRIQADGQNLTISAERREEEQEEGRKFASERPTKLQRTIRLPTRANVNEADAAYENGVCKIVLPKMEEEKQHEIAFQ